MTSLALDQRRRLECTGPRSTSPGCQGLGDCRVIAPEEPHSGCGHRVTTHGPILVRRPTADHIAVAGTPVDCVRLALHHLAPEVDWVLSGINPGGNWARMSIIPAPWRPCVREPSAESRESPCRITSHEGGRSTGSRSTLGPRRPRLVDGSALGPGRSGTSISLTSGPTIPIPKSFFARSTLLPCPFRTSFEDGQAVYTGDYQSRIRRSRYDVDVCFSGQIAVTQSPRRRAATSLDASRASLCRCRRPSDTLAESGPNMP